MKATSSTRGTILWNVLLVLLFLLAGVLLSLVMLQFFLNRRDIDAR